MKASRDYLLEALEKTPGETGEEKAKHLKISGNTLSQYKRGERIMDDFACIMVGRQLGIDPMKIIAACQEEREKNQERKEFWRDFRNTLSGLGIAAALGATMTAAPDQAHAYTVKLQNDNVFIMSNLRRKKRSFHLLSRLLRIGYTTRFAYA